mgnify:CR=1 FL=1
MALLISCCGALGVFFKKVSHAFVIQAQDIIMNRIFAGLAVFIIFNFVFFLHKCIS